MSETAQYDILRFYMYSLAMIDNRNFYKLEFDQLLTTKKFRYIEKIKTIGSTYMVASGLHVRKTDAIINVSQLNNQSQHLQEEVKGSNWKHLKSLVDFSFAMREKLKAINDECLTDFELKIGSYLKRYIMIVT